MALNLTKALSAYDRTDTTKVDCGGGWTWEIKPFSAVAKIFSKEQARMRSLGVAKKKVAKTNSAVLTNIDQITQDNEHMLGTYDADVAFFIENLSVGWDGLLDDTGTQVPYSAEAAEEIFTKNGSAGEQLFKELVMSSLDQALFVRGGADDVAQDPDAPITAEDDSKN